MKNIVAITGGIGSGKSEVLRIIQGMGYDVISADDVNRELLQDEDYLNRLKENFSTAFPNNIFDKKILSNIIFNDKEKRLLLNSIAHHQIRLLIDARISQIDNDIVFVEVPLLVESGMIDMFTDIIVVTASRETKISRVMVRDNITYDDVVKRMSSQLLDDDLLKIATYVIENNSTKVELRSKTIDVIKSILNK